MMSPVYRILCAWCFLSLALRAPAQIQPVIAIDPAVVTNCSTAGLGQATILWNYTGPGPVVVHVNSAGGPAMTGLSGPSGSAATGSWVTDGMVFVLTNSSGQQLGSAIARVACNPAGEVVPAALTTAPYFPLQVGDNTMEPSVQAGRKGRVFVTQLNQVRSVALQIFRLGKILS